MSEISEKKKTLLDRLMKAAEELETVKVVTLVDQVTVTLDASSGRATIQHSAQAADAFVTYFHLLDGDVSNVVPPSLKDDTALREFHSTQVEKASKVLPANLESLVKAVQSFIG